MSTSESIRTQIEYYFGDSNIQRDVHLKNILSIHKNYVPVEILLSFPRIKSLTQRPQDIIDSLQDSKIVTCGIHGIQRINRNKVYNPVPRTVYYASDSPNSIESMKEMFTKYGVVISVKIAHGNHTFIEFDSKDSAEKCIFYHEGTMLKAEYLKGLQEKKALKLVTKRNDKYKMKLAQFITEWRDRCLIARKKCKLHSCDEFEVYRFNSTKVILKKANIKKLNILQNLHPLDEEEDVGFFYALALQKGAIRAITCDNFASFRIEKVKGFKNVKSVTNSNISTKKQGICD